MRVWIVTVGEPLPGDGPGTRTLRSGLLADALVRKGAQVTWFTSVFDHTSKTHRTLDNQHKWPESIQPRWLRSPGYRRNVSVRRLLDHRIAAHRFRGCVRKEAPPHVILCSLPTLDLSVAAVEYGQRVGVPVILDIRDWWPDEFVNVAPPLLRGTAGVLAYPFRRMAMRACRGATAISGITEAFVHWGLALAGRGQTHLDRAFSMGYTDPGHTDSELAEGYAFWRGHGVLPNDGVFTACYIGNVSDTVDLDTVCRAAGVMAERGFPHRVLVCGSGPALADLRRRFSHLANIVFAGRVAKAELQAAMTMSTVGLAPYIPTPSFRATLSNKMLEYLAGGLVILTSLPDGPLVELLDKYKCGMTYRIQDTASLVNALENVRRSPETGAMQTRARALYQHRFRADVVYNDMAEYLMEFGATTDVRDLRLQ